jgi:hypothetical protein
MSTIFISYRREDTAGYAISLHDRLAARFGAEHIFMDIDNIELGEDFVDVINEKISACDVLLVLIGRNWLTSQDESGRRRLDSPDDFVRLEVAAALERKIRVIPVLFGGTRPPRPEDLPPELVLLSRRNAITITDAGFRQDVTRLIESVEKVIASSGADATMPRQVAQPAASAIAPTADPALARSDDRNWVGATGHADGEKTSQPRASNAVATKTTRPSEESRAIAGLGAAKGAKAKPAERTGIEIYCEKPWSGLGADPECYITLPDSGFSLKKTLKWETHVFIALEPNQGYSLAIKRPSDLLSYKATINVSLVPGEVRRYRYESPAISFMSGDIKRDD